MKSKIEPKVAAEVTIFYDDEPEIPGWPWVTTVKVNDEVFDLASYSYLKESLRATRRWAASRSLVIISVKVIPSVDLLEDDEGVIWDGETVSHIVLKLVDRASYKEAMCLES